MSMAKAEAAGRNSIRINGPIYSYDNAAENFQRAVEAGVAEGRDFDLIINSPGGDPIETSAMVDVMISTNATFNAYIYGIAASSASFIAATCDKVFIGKNSRYMIHEANSGAIGGANDMRAVAEILDTLNVQMRDAYAAKTGKSPEDVAVLMAEEKWYLGKEAVEAGFADELIDAEFEACVDEEIVRTFAHAPNDVVEAAQAQAEVDAEEDDAGAGDQAQDDEARQAPAPVQENADLSDEDKARIRAACAAFDAEDRAEGFIEAKADFSEVKKQLWNAQAQTDDKTETDTTVPDPEPVVPQVSAASQLNKVRANALKAVRGNPKRN